ncbi:MAG: hypothetical protein JXR42_04990 [Gammaproteobacteria bacterium]|nr:hypothetical protein [Gammaproteobacteria bacterium]
MKKSRILAAVLAATFSVAAFAGTDTGSFTAQVTIDPGATITTIPSGTLSLGSLDLLSPTTLTSSTENVGVTGIKGTHYTITCANASITKVGGSGESLNFTFQDDSGTAWNSTDVATTGADITSTGVEETYPFKLNVSLAEITTKLSTLSAGTYEGTATFTVTYS